ncbi:MAG: PhaM family polyhydroxyalkanoate granule multifunctional regulatory protein [Ramlibacter sp.]
MSDTPMTAFGKFVPGFDFLQNIAKGTSQAMPQMPSLANWVAPTLNVEELEKRIGELKAVHFWLEQNSNALAATIQALEVQKMTLATLKGMNFSMGELANAMQLKPAEAAADKAAAPAQHAPGASSAQPANGKRKAGATAQTAGGVVDPLQWWGALTQQFQQIAADAMKDAAQHTGVDPVSNMASGIAHDAMKTATSVMTSATPGSGAKPARKAAVKARKPRKPAAGKSVARKSASR